MGISIENPCSEDWSKMTATDKGAFCMSCSKEVVDFTGRAAPEIRSLLAESMNKDKNVCGRISPMQMNVLNADFEKWQTNQESFRAVWIFSLIAVFGLTLFSCQNSASKEIVNQINVQATEMIALESAEVETIDPTDTEVVEDYTLIDEISQIENAEIPKITDPASITYQIITVTGSMSYYPLIGDIAVSGWVSCGPSEEEQRFKRYLEEYEPISAFVASGAEEIKPNFHFSEVSTLISSRLNDILSPTDPEFDAQISPIPINSSSRLYLSLSEAAEVSIRVSNQAGTLLTKLEKLLFSRGEHEVDLHLIALIPGDYTAVINALSVEKIIEFNVLSNPIFDPTTTS
jgi:hypothetical protein